MSIDHDQISTLSMIVCLLRACSVNLIPLKVERSFHGWHLKYACVSEKLYAALTENNEKSVQLRSWLGDDPVRAELDLRRPPEKRFVLFDVKIRKRMKRDRKK